MKKSVDRSESTLYNDLTLNKQEDLIMETLMHVRQAQRLTYANFKNRKLTRGQLMELDDLKERVKVGIKHLASNGRTMTVVSHPNENILKAVQMWVGLQGYKTEIEYTLVSGTVLHIDWSF